MAEIVDAVKQSTSSSRTLASLLQNPMFQELKITLENECAQMGVPYTLVLGEERMSDSLNNNQELIVEEATLQAEFKQLAPLRNNKVQELEKFFNMQHVALVTQRTDAIAKVHSGALSQELLHQELASVTQYYNKQQSHLIQRVSRSLQLLKQVIPPDTVAAGLKSRPTKSRLLNSNAVKIMNDWYQRHMDHPYPTEEEKHQMAAAGKVSVAQVKAWFANKRNRTLNTKPKRQQMKLKQQLTDICDKLNVQSKPDQEYMYGNGACDDLAWLVATTIETPVMPDSTSLLKCEM